MASLSISTAFKPSISPSPSIPKPLKTLTFFSKPPSPPQIKAIASSYSPPKPTMNAELGLGLSPFYSATREMTMGEVESDVMGLLLRERIVFLGNEINDFVADAIISQILLLDAQDHTKDIKLFINSPGGSLSATMAIFDVVQLVRADVSTVGMGIAASTSSIILGGGTKGKRFAMPNTRIMIHQPLGGASGQAIDVEIQAKEILHNKNNIIRIVSNFTGRSLELAEKDIDRDRYMSPIEAVEYGIIDGVIDRNVIIPLMPVPDKMKPKLNYEEISKDPKKFFDARDSR